MYIHYFSGPPSEDLGSGYESDSESGDSDVDRASFTTDDIILDDFIDRDHVEATRETSHRVILEEPKQVGEVKKDKIKEENKEPEATKEETKELEATGGESSEREAIKEELDVKEETKELEATQDEPKEVGAEGNVVITINDYSATATNEATTERPIQSVSEPPEGVVHDRSGDEQCAGVPPLSSLCVSVLVTYPSDYESDSNRVKSDNLRVNLNESLLSNGESDCFNRSPSPCGGQPSEDSEGWVAVKRVVGDSVVEEEKETNEEEDRPSPTFTLAIISRRSRHRAGY